MAVRQPTAWSLLPCPAMAKTRHRSRSQPYQQRLAEAKKLLAAAGFGTSKPLRFTLDYQNVEDGRRVAVALQAMWRSIGADVKLTTTGFESKDSSLRNGDFDVSWFTFYAPYSDATAFLYLLEANNVAQLLTVLQIRNLTRCSVLQIACRIRLREPPT